MLLVRVDANERIGIGHFVRCLGIADAWRAAGGRVTFAMHDPPASLRAKLDERGVALVNGEDPDATVRAARSVSARAVVLDGYAFGASFQTKLREANVACAVVDDNGEAGSYAANVVVNGNASADEAMYAKRHADTRLLLGVRYALLRREFTERTPRRPREAGTLPRVLATFGGADPTDVTTRAVAALRRLAKRVEATILVGPARARPDAIVVAAQDLPGARILFDAPSMPDLMETADVALTAAGSTCLELAHMAVPAIAVVVAENQRAGAERLAALGVLRSLTDAEATPDRLASSLEALLSDEPARTKMAALGRELVDGRGAARVVAAIREVSA
jgi:UDP-2,4-diacetamido-2,4,6-trideoxy-beta-L-altropyranose hydrolase